MEMNAVAFRKFVVIGGLIILVLIVAYIVVTRPRTVQDNDTYNVVYTPDQDKYNVTFKRTPTQDEIRQVEQYLKEVTGRSDFYNDPRVNFVHYGTFLEPGQPELDKDAADAEELKAAEQRLYEERVKQQTVSEPGEAEEPQKPGAVDDITYIKQDEPED